MSGSIGTTIRRIRARWRGGCAPHARSSALRAERQSSGTARMTRTTPIHLVGCCHRSPCRGRGRRHRVLVGVTPVLVGVTPGRLPTTSATSSASTLSATAASSTRCLSRKSDSVVFKASFRFRALSTCLAFAGSITQQDVGMGVMT